MLCKTGLASLTRSGVVEDIPFTGLCFQPKAVIIYATNSSGTMGYSPNGGEADINMGWGVGPTLSTEQWSQRTRHDAASVRFNTEDTTDIGGAQIDFISLVSLDSSGFTMNLPSVGTVNFFFMALGGDDLEASMGTFTPATTGNSVAVTGVGFQPDFLIAMHTDDTDGLSSNYSVGMASSPSDQAAVEGGMGLSSGHQATLLIDRLCVPGGVGGGDSFRVHLTSFDTDGFTVYSDDFFRNSGGGVRYLALKDPTAQFSVGIGTAPTSPGSLSVTAPGFLPGGGIFIPSQKTTDNDTAYIGYPLMGWGMADGVTNQNSATMWSTGGGFGGSEQNGYQEQDLVIDVSQVSSSFSSVTPLVRASLDSWDANGFTLDYSVATGTAYKFLYGVFETTMADPCGGFLPQIYRRLPR